MSALGTAVMLPSLREIRKVPVEDTICGFECFLPALTY
jgi:hypothetical protein